MVYLKKFKYSILIFFALAIGGLVLNANYYINKRPVTNETRVIIEQKEITFFEHTRLLEVGKHTEENVLLGYHPDFDWGQELSFDFSDEKKEVTFENIPNFEYGSVTTEIMPKGSGVSANFSVDESKAGQQFRPVYYSDVEVTSYYVDVYNVFGKYKYSFNTYSNAVVNDTLELSIMSSGDAESLGIMQ